VRRGKLSGGFGSETQAGFSASRDLEQVQFPSHSCKFASVSCDLPKKTRGRQRSTYVAELLIVRVELDVVLF
jgi:hypothetical protein